MLNFDKYKIKNVNVSNDKIKENKKTINWFPIECLMEDEVVYEFNIKILERNFFSISDIYFKKNTKNGNEIRTMSKLEKVKLYRELGIYFMTNDIKLRVLYSQRI